MGLESTSIFKLENTVLKVSSEAKTIVPMIVSIQDEDKLLSELILCILSSQDKYEIALAAMKAFQYENVLIIPYDEYQLIKFTENIKRVLSRPMQYKINGKSHSRRLRFFLKKGTYIINTIQNIYLNNLTINQIINNSGSFEDARKNIIDYGSGLGPKQASMFLRNIGYYKECAVLDKHIIDYMRIMGLVYTHASTYSSISSYQRIEKRLKWYADFNNVSLLHLDLAIWTTMRTLKKY